MGFNEEQLRAINASSKKDILIVAGAGSGKTKTLSERVNGLIKNGDIKPDELLVLTFTNNAAYEMKTRILATFADDPDNYAKMLSSHVQSFDSFNAYLVRLYAGRLGVAPSFSILSDTVYEQRKRFETEEAINRCILDENKRHILVDFMCQLGLKNTAKVNDFVLFLLKKFEQFTPADRKKFIEDYREKYLSESHAKDLYDAVVKGYQDSLKSILRKAFILDRISHVIVREAGEEASYEEVLHTMDSALLWETPLDDAFITPDQCNVDDFLGEEFQDLLALSSCSSEAFVERCRDILTNRGEVYFARVYPNPIKTINDSSYHEPVFKALKEAKAVLEKAVSLDSLEEEWAKMCFFQDGVSLLLELCQEVNAKLDEYRKIHNAFTFADITALALSLFTSPEYEDIAESLRLRFRYIMVDEYQDTNDFQEIFLEGLLKPAKDGSRSHLFCVGDAKQSIYAFRNSNVALFRARQSRYLHEEGTEVIAMNKNYRSAKRLLDDINFIFSYYMRPDLGGIDYLDVMERLTYDTEVNLYNVELEDYGVHRILPPDTFKLVNNKSVRLDPFADVEYESRAILADIQKKLKEGFLVFDRSAKKGESHVRPCRYNDFCILIRKKKSVLAYQKLFAEAGIPLNNKVSVDLREVNASVLIQSLLSVIGYIVTGEECNLPHAFASIARSYVYQYSDAVLHLILSGNAKDEEHSVLKAIEEDPIMLDLQRFCASHQSCSFSQIFLDLLDQFHVIDKLYLIGDIEDNLSKIESLYAMVRDCESLGKGLKEFVALFKDIARRSLTIATDSVFETSDAVDLMTIHASKGLERKIVYMPSLENGISSGDLRSTPMFQFSQSDGISFPYLDYPFDNEPNPETSVSYLTLPLRRKQAQKLNEEEQEHVRLLYVALTRAENTVYIVGRDKGRRSCYVMYEPVPSFIHIHPDLLSKACISEATRRGYLASIQYPKQYDLPYAGKFDEITYAAYSSLKQQYLEDAQEERALESARQVLVELYAGYEARLGEISDLDDVARLYAMTLFPVRFRQDQIHDLDSLYVSLNRVQEIPEEDQDDLDDDEKEGLSAANFSMTKGELAIVLDRFLKALKDHDVQAAFPHLAIPTTKEKDKDYKDDLLIDALLYPFVSFFDHVPYVCYRSYHNEGAFRDKVYIYEDQGADNTTREVPVLKELPVDDSLILFPKVDSGRASKKASDEELPDELILERGNRLHRYMELLDFETFDTFFIPVAEERRTIEKALNTPLMQEAKSADAVYREYGYYDPDLLTTGFIDMFFVKDGVYTIVDYKSSHIDDAAYDEQLRVYARNIMRLFGVNPSDIRLYLLSLGKGITRQVKLSDEHKDDE